MPTGTPMNTLHLIPGQVNPLLPRRKIKMRNTPRIPHQLPPRPMQPRLPLTNKFRKRNHRKTRRPPTLKLNINNLMIAHIIRRLVNAFAVRSGSESFVNLFNVGVHTAADDGCRPAAWIVAGGVEVKAGCGVWAFWLVCAVGAAGCGSCFDGFLVFAKVG